MTEAERLSARLDLTVFRYNDRAHYEAACTVDAEYWTVGARRRMRGVAYEESVDTMQWRLMALAALTNPHVVALGISIRCPLCKMATGACGGVLDARGIYATKELLFLAALLGGL
jgi:hypothetical protein